MGTESRMIDQESSENLRTVDHGIVVENVVGSTGSVKFREGPSEVLGEGPGKGVEEEGKRRVTGERFDRIDEGTSEPSGCIGDTHVINVDSEQVDGGVEELEAKGKELQSRNVLEDKLTKNGDKECVIDVMRGKSWKSGENSDGEVVCRICHLSADQSPKASRAAAKAAGTTTKDLIQLGCECKGELGTAHRHCAEAWFKLKGNRSCEICGEVAKNVTGVGDSRFMEAWNERRFTISGGNSERGRCWQGQPLCNFLMACLVIAFVLPWFFRVNMF